MVSRYTRNCALFIVVLLAIVFGFYFTSKRSYQDDLFKFPSSRNILVAGDSRTALSINDTIFSRAINVSNPAELYVYTYAKLKKLLPLNPQVDTVLLSFTFHSLTELTAHWSADVSMIRERLPRFAPLLGLEEESDLAIAAPLTFFEGLLETDRKNFSNILSSKRLSQFGEIGIGGYNPMAGEMSDWQATVKPEKDADEKMNTPYGMQIKYLEKIITLCSERGVTVILFSPPVHSSNPRRSMTPVILKKSLPSVSDKILLLDYSEMQYADSLYRDYLHFNPRGAKVFSSYLQQNGLRPFSGE